MQTHYYANTIRNICIAFLDLFNDISVKRYAKNSTTVVKTIAVPIIFGPVEKFHQTRMEEESLERYYQSLPRMAVSLESIEYNPDRCVGANELRTFFDTVSGSEIPIVIQDVEPTPYDLTFKMQIKSNSMSDFSQILENVLPYFNPSLYLRVREFSFLNLERNLRVTLESVIPEFSEEIDETSTRVINGTLTFKIDAYMFRPTDNAKIIKVIDTRYFMGSDIDLSTSASYNEQFSTSGVNALSAAPDSSQYDLSGATDDGKNWYTKITFNGL